MINFTFKIRSFDKKAFPKSRFNIRVAPLEDELLSSWLVRTAVANLTDPVTFMNIHVPDFKNSLFSRDIDISASKRFIEIIAKKNNRSPNEIRALTLQSYEKHLSNTFYTNTRNVLIQPLVNRGRLNKRGGQRFCPICLKEDETPYLRKKWRLSFSTACPKHKVFLAEECPTCKKPITQYKRKGNLIFPICYNCGYDLRNTPVERIDPRSYGLRAIEKYYKVLSSRKFKYANGEMQSTDFFAIVKQLVKIIYFWGYNNKAFEHEVMKDRIELYKNRPKLHLLERIPLKEQYLVFSAIMKIMENFPNSFIYFVEQNNLTKTPLTKDFKNMPDFYYKIALRFAAV